MDEEEEDDDESLESESIPGVTRDVTFVGDRSPRVCGDFARTSGKRTREPESFFLTLRSDADSR